MVKCPVQLKASFGSAIASLTADHVPSPRLNAELLLMFVLNCDRAYLFAHPERELSSEEQARYDAALAERARGVPTQYITGHQEFWGMDLIVTPAVLIPRPETEHVIETVLKLQTSDLRPPTCAPEAPAQAPRSEVRRPTPGFLRILDVGTGSGCIALALAKEFPDAEIYATDISAAALEVAQANAARHQLEQRIHFHQADLLEGPNLIHLNLTGLDLTNLDLTNLDFIVSNPPYVGESEEEQVQLEVRKFEPRNAVFAGPEGTEVIARLLPQAHAALRPEGWLILEISGTIASSVQQLLNAWNDVRIIPDLQGIPRVLQARKP